MMLATTAPPQIYRQFFTVAERRLLDSTPLETALSEISLLRILLTRLLAAASQKKPLSLKGRIAMLAAFSHAGVILSTLVRFNLKYRVLADPDDMLFQLLGEMDPYDL